MLVGPGGWVELRLLGFMKIEMPDIDGRWKMEDRRWRSIDKKELANEGSSYSGHWDWIEFCRIKFKIIGRYR
jgi:hypothetical protein